MTGVLEGDIEACFDNIDHTALMDRVRRRVGDKRVRSVADAASVVYCSLTDSRLVAETACASEAVIHTAVEHGAGPANGRRCLGNDRAGCARGLADPDIRSSGAWVFGAGDAITEDWPYRPPPLTAWRVPIEKRIRRSRVPTTIIAPGLIHDDDANGVISILRPDACGVVRLMGDGQQHWTTAHPIAPRQ